MEPVCDLVLLSWNHLEETKPCLESLFKATQTPCRLFIVDNGSEPHVRAFLNTVAPQGAILEVRVLQNETNEGFPRGMNTGIRASTAPYVCILNNDLVFAPDWLEEMIEVAAATPGIGIVNPGSSNFGLHPPKDVAFDTFAREHRARFRGRYTEVGMCIGFCVLIKREIVEKVGYLTEEVDRIFFEDEDYSMRVVQAGYQCVVAEGAYVHHAEHKTVKSGPAREALFNKNKDWCERKWGKRTRLVWPRFAPPVPGSQELKQWLETLVQWARRRAHVYVYAPLPKGQSKESLFASVGMIPHADVQWHPIPESAAGLFAAGCVLKRRKKRFDMIAAPTERWANTLRGLQWLHGADVVPETSEAELLKRWKEKSRSPL